MAVAIWIGQLIPFDVASFIPSESPEHAQAVARKGWAVALLAYCCVASVLPMWMLLQPRGQLGGFFLYVALAGAMIGLILGGQTIQLPAFTGWTTPKHDTLFPVLFITVACGACSGFHALIASGTTSKQIRRETDARPIGYGAMLLEAMVAVTSLCCVMMIAPGSQLLENPQPNFIYAQGIGSFLGTVGIPVALGVSFAMMAFTTFVYDTLDVCTRLGRYVVQELTGWHDNRGKWIGTIATAGASLVFLMQPAFDATGKPVAVWRAYWGLFGASNQLLAALTLLAITVWLWRTRGAWWVWPVIGIPTVFMYFVSVWALLQIIANKFAGGLTLDLVGWVALVLVILSALMLVEAVIAIIRPRTLSGPPREPMPVGASAIEAC